MLQAAINTLLTHENIVNTYAYDLRPVDASGLPDDKMAAHWKLYIIQVGGFVVVRLLGIWVLGTGVCNLYTCAKMHMR